MVYIARVADSELANRLGRSGAVLVEGAKGCGKTEMATRAAASWVRVDTDPDVPALMEIDPSRILDGAVPRLIDEWQWQPDLWNHIRRAVDDRKAAGQFILTGSSTPEASVRRHSGAGRFSVMRLRPMSLWELGLSTGEVSWQAIREGGSAAAAVGALGVDEWAEVIAAGGWPAMARRGAAEAREYVLDYLDLLAEADMSAADQVRRDPVRVRRLLASIGRNTATTATIATLTADTAGSDSRISRDTVSAYLAALNRLMIAEDLPAWTTALRDSATLRKAPKRHLVDPSLAAGAMGATPAKLSREPKTLGNLFESLVIRDLRVYCAAARGELFHHRDSAGREIDAIVAYPDGWVACEVKLGAGAVEAAAQNLKAVVSKIDTQTVGPPDALVIVTGTGPGYRRRDGVHVIPASALKP
ncbi:MAG: ATP-binding protein [Bifidobacteriaceae bacterium]|jgi:predicted AAA+ superfamily ATPase|nr:ATP-binding protein [Bifidobacteriaceae bacterium]